MTDILIDACKIALGQIEPWPDWNTPERALKFLRSEHAEFWAALIGIDDLQAIIKRLDGGVTDYASPEKFLPD